MQLKEGSVSLTL
ncbi:hypothetical protein IGG80_001807 [Enterococcus faecalis]|nr:hypothetical protein [Enterococcus faecalis]